MGRRDTPLKGPCRPLPSRPHSLTAGEAKHICLVLEAGVRPPPPSSTFQNLPAQTGALSAHLGGGRRLGVGKHSEARPDCVSRPGPLKAEPGAPSGGALLAQDHPVAPGSPWPWAASHSGGREREARQARWRFSENVMKPTVEGAYSRGRAARGGTTGCRGLHSTWCRTQQAAGGHGSSPGARPNPHPRGGSDDRSRNKGDP